MHDPNLLAVSKTFSTNGLFSFLTPIVIGYIVGAGVLALILIKLWSALPKWLIVVLLLGGGVLAGFLTVHSRR